MNKFGCQSMYAPIRRMMLKHPREAFISQANLEAQWEQGKFLCVGLDSDLEKIPEAARIDGTRETIVNFNRAIIDATRDIVCAFKINPAFYEAHGDEG